MRFIITPLKLRGTCYSLAPDCYRLLSSPHKQSGQYNETTLFWLVWVFPNTSSRNYQTYYTIGQGVATFENSLIFMIYVSHLILILVQRQEEIFPRWRIEYAPKCFLSLLDNFLIIYHFGMWKVN